MLRRHWAHAKASAPTLEQKHRKYFLRFTYEEQVALDYAGVKAADATFTKAHRDYDDGRQVYEIEFYANNTEYDMDVDVNTGRVTDFSTEYHGGYTQPAGNAYGYYYDDDLYDYDYDDMYDFDDMFDFD